MNIFITKVLTPKFNKLNKIISVVAIIATASFVLSVTATSEVHAQWYNSIEEQVEASNEKMETYMLMQEEKRQEEYQLQQRQEAERLQELQEQQEQQLPKSADLPKWEPCLKYTNYTEC